MFQGEIIIFTTWLLYVELFLVITCGIIWSWRLTACLVLYDPLVILPLMVGTYILFGGVGGGIYFREFDTMKGALGWSPYLSGIVCV